MSQRNSGYERKDRDLYETPAWVTQALIPHLPRVPSYVWEPACGSGNMVGVLQQSFSVTHSDISTGTDFLVCKINRFLVDAIITNPPYDHDVEFIEHALKLMQPSGGVVAMLLNSDFDHASTRKHLFQNCPAFCKTVVLTKRIKWFNAPVKCRKCNGGGFTVFPARCRACSGKGEKMVGPSENHSWFIWDWQHKGPSTKAYGP